MVQKVEITKLDLSNKTSSKMIDYVAEETPFHLFANKTFWATILCSPTDLKDLAVGHFLSESIIKSVDEIDEIMFKETENSCSIRLKPEIKIEDRIKISRLHARVVPSACGSESSYQFKGKIPKIDSDLRVNAQVLAESVNKLNFNAEGFRKTGGLHVASIYNSNGSLLALAEDVGRHNAVDKVIGISALNKVNFSDCFIALSGRMSGDVAFKAANVRLPIVASLAAALSSGIDIAREAKITLIGFVRGKRMNIYTAPERIILAT